MTKRSKKALAAPTVYITYWLTRDSNPETGAPSGHVDVWWSKPVRYKVGERGSFWLDRHCGLAERQACWAADTTHALGPCPDDGTQCIRVGPERTTRDALATGKPGEA